MLLNCGSGEDSWESLGLQGDQTSQSIKEINPEYSSEGRCWSWNSNTLATLRADSLEKTDAGKDWKRSRVNPLMNRVKGYASSQQNWVYWGVTEGFFTTWTTREASLMAQMVKNLPAMQETWLDSWARKIPWRRDRWPTPVFLGFPGGSDGKESDCNEGDVGWEDLLEEGMATHSSILTWRTQWIEQPGGLHSMGSQRVGHDRSG